MLAFAQEKPRNADRKTGGPRQTEAEIVQVRHMKPARIGLYVITAVWLLVMLPLSVAAAPYAAVVMDARTGEVLHARNADTRLHPASSTEIRSGLRSSVGRT